MTKTSKTLVFFGTEDFSLVALRGLIEAGYTIAAVVTKPDSKKGRGHKVTPPQVKVLAEAHGIPVWQPTKLTAIADDIVALGDVAGVLVSYGKIIPQSIIDLFSPGIINVHPSLLPIYRGPSPIESAIKNDDAETGVSIMRLSAAMDAGPVYAQSSHALSGTETRPALYATLATGGTKLLLDTLPAILDGSLTPAPQDDSKAVYCSLLDKRDALLDLTSMSAAQAERTIRAHLGFPKSKLELLGQPCVITAAHVSAKKNTPLDLQCQDGAFLCIDELIAPSGKQMNADAFLRGYAA